MSIKAEKDIKMNMSLSPSQTKDALRLLLKSREVPMIWGPPGIGKSAICQELANETGRRLIDIRLALWDPTDIRGIPYFDPEHKQMLWAAPSEFPKVASDNSIILLDELPSAAPTVQVGAYQLTLNRKIGTYSLPDGVDVMAAGNRETDRGVSFKMPSPLANRMTHIEMKVDHSDFIQWAIDNNMETSVISYLAWAKADIFDFDPQRSGKAFATPRSWEKAANIIQNSKGCSEAVLTSVIAGTVGEGLAIKYMAHRKISMKLPKSEDILDGKLKTFKYGKDISILYALIMNCCHDLRERKDTPSKKFLEYVDNFYMFMLSNFPQEYLVMGVKLSIRNFGLPIDPEKLKSYDLFMEKVEKHLFSND
jgi:hypothetical protein